MWVPNLRGGLLCSVEANHQPASADQHTYCLTPIGGGLPLFTENPRRKMFSETHIRGGETLCVWTGGKPIFSLCLGPMEHAA